MFYVTVANFSKPLDLIFFGRGLFSFESCHNFNRNHAFICSRLKFGFDEKAGFFSFPCFASFNGDVLKQ